MAARSKQGGNDSGGTKLYEVLRETKLEKAVADARKLSTLCPDTKEWMSGKFY